MLAWGEHSSRPVYIISVPGQSVPAGMPCQHDIFSCWATYIQIFFGKIHNIVITTVTNSTNVEPVSYIYIIKPTGCQNNPGRVFPLDASASIPVLVQANIHKFLKPAFLALWRGIHQWPVDSPHEGASNAENVSIAWRHHASISIRLYTVHGFKQIW